MSACWQSGCLFRTHLNDVVGPAADQEDLQYCDPTPEFEYCVDGVEDDFNGDS